jgi:hypothetical protein
VHWLLCRTYLRLWFITLLVQNSDSAEHNSSPSPFLTRVEHESGWPWWSSIKNEEDTHGAWCHTTLWKYGEQFGRLAHILCHVNHPLLLGSSCPCSVQTFSDSCTHLFKRLHYTFIQEESLEITKAESEQSASFTCDTRWLSLSKHFHVLITSSKPPKNNFLKTNNP